MNPNDYPVWPENPNDHPVWPKNPNDYPVWPEDDGTDTKRNPYSPV